MLENAVQTPHKQSLWLGPRTVLLIRLWRDGLSASKIAKEIGGVTRNAVIGRAHRLHLPARMKAPIRSAPPKPRKSRARTDRGVARWARLKAKAAVAVDDAKIPFAQRKTFAQLNKNTCRWPVGHVGEPGFFFCGAKSQTTRPYCAGHAKRAYGFVSEGSSARTSSQRIGDVSKRRWGARLQAGAPS